jgi:hypothetical protein
VSTHPQHLPGSYEKTQQSPSVTWLCSHTLRGLLFVQHTNSGQQVQPCQYRVKFSTRTAGLHRCQQDKFLKTQGGSEHWQLPALTHRCSSLSQAHITSLMPPHAGLVLTGHVTSNMMMMLSLLLSSSDDTTAPPHMHPSQILRHCKVCSDHVKELDAPVSCSHPPPSHQKRLQLLLSTGPAGPWHGPWSVPCTVALREAFRAAHRACGPFAQLCRCVHVQPCEMKWR